MKINEMKINKMVNLYLEKNGIQKKYFANYIRKEPSSVYNWLLGDTRYKLNDKEMERVYSFLRGEAFKSMDKILKNELD